VQGRELARAVISVLAGTGSIGKVTFAGGEPLLCPWLPEMLRLAKDLGLTTMVVTNGSLLSTHWLEANAPHLDWVAVSIDSVDPRTNAAAGRSVKGRGPLTEAEYLAKCRSVRETGVRLKVNTTVTRFNWEEDLSSLVAEVRPDRWKVFQALPVAGQNHARAGQFVVTRGQFQAFCSRHAAAGAVVEDNSRMTGSYLMIDCYGRLFDNVTGRYRRGPPVAEVGWEAALSGVAFSPEGFLARGGRYDWSPNAHRDRLPPRPVP
jgi:radical S-adenosyl methionine domain-containing protein 2